MILPKLVSQLSILFFCKVSVNQKTKYDPYVVTSEDILKTFSERIDTPMVKNMKIGMFIFIFTYFNFANSFFLLGCFARMFHLGQGRNKGTSWMNYEDIKHFLPEIDLQIKAELNDKVPTIKSKNE